MGRRSPKQMLERLHAMNGRGRRRGFLERGPLFWIGLMLAAYGVIAALALTEAVEGVSLVIIALIPASLLVPILKSAGRAMDEGDPSCLARGQAQKRYVKRIAIFTAMYLLAIALLAFVETGGVSGRGLRPVIAVLPGLAIIGVLWTIGRLIVEEQDEFLRTLTIKQSLIATAITLSAAAIWGFLESADIVIHLDAYWWTVVWFVGLFIGAVINRIEHGTWGAV